MKKLSTILFFAEA